MKTFDPNQLHPRAFYSLFTGILAPRPIAWIVSKNSNETLNLAPYSFFSGINTRPPMIMVSIGTIQGEKKHTSENILRTSECVIHIADVSMLDALNASAHRYEKGVSEVDILKLETEASTHIHTPRLKGVLAAFECRLHSHHTLPNNDVVYFDVVSMHINNAAVKDGQIDVEKVKPLSRFMGNYYGIDYTFTKTNHPDHE